MKKEDYMKLTKERLAESVRDVIPTDITTIKAIGDNQIPENFDVLIKS